MALALAVSVFLVPDPRVMVVSSLLAYAANAVIERPSARIVRGLDAVAMAIVIGWMIGSAVVVTRWPADVSLGVSTVGRLIDVEYHLGYLVGPALVSAESALQSVYPETSTALFVIAALSGLRSSGEAIRLLVLGQSLALAIVLFLATRVLGRSGRSARWAGFAFAFAFAVPLAPLSPTLLYPNFSAVRYVWALLLLSLAYGALVARITPRRWILLGALAVLGGPSGIAVLLGAILARLQAAILLRRRMLSMHVLREIIPAILTFLAVSWAVGITPLGQNTNGTTFILQAVTVGVAYEPQPIPFLGVLSLASAGAALLLSPRLASRPRHMQWAALCGAAGLVWGAYFVNRPVIPGVFFVQLLSMLGLLPFAVRRSSGDVPHGRLARGLLALLASAGLVTGLGSVVGRSVDAGPSSLESDAVSGDIGLELRGCGGSASLLQGLCLSSELQEAASESLSELDGIRRSGIISNETVVVGAQKFSIESAGFNREDDLNRFFGSGVSSVAMVDRLQQHLTAHGYGSVVLQARESVFTRQTELPAVAETGYARVEEMLLRLGYRPVARGGHWVVFVHSMP